MKVCLRNSLRKVTQNQPLPKPAKPAHRVRPKRTPENPANNATHSSKPWPVLTRKSLAGFNPRNDSYKDNAICGDGGISPYTADDVFLIADEKDNSSNSYVHAVKKIGPPRCWLTRNASVYGIACNTADAWAPEWSDRVARVGVTVAGTPTLLYGVPNQSGQRASIKFFELSEEYFNAKDFLNSPHWSKFEGSQ